MATMRNLSEEDLKLQGDQQFKDGKFEDALKSYTGALSKNPRNYKHLIGRALCYEQLNQWDLFIVDWSRALDIKGQMLYTTGLLLGARVLRSEGAEEASKYFDSVRDLARQRIEDNSKEYALMLERTRQEYWVNSESKAIERENRLLDQLLGLLRYETKTCLFNLRKINFTEEEIQNTTEELNKECENHCRELRNIFNKVQDKRKNREIPHHLFCPISYELFKDPVITPSGITYDRKSLEQHFNRCGLFDPASRAPLTRDQLIQNRAIMTAVDSFLADNEWARHE